MNETAIEQAFTEASLAATQILKFAVERPDDYWEVMKRGPRPPDVNDPPAMVAYLAKSLARRIAEVSVPGYVEHQAQKSAQRAERIAKYEAKQAEIAAQHVACSETPCELCVIAKDEQEWYDRIVDKTAAPHLDEDRAMHPEVPVTPGFAGENEKPKRVGDQGPAPSAVIESGVSKALIEAGFTDEGEGEWIHRSLQHVVKMESDGSFLIRSGWRTDEVLKGETAEDLQEALAVLDE